MEKKAAKLKKGLTWLLVVLLAASAAVIVKGYRDGCFASVETFQAYIGSFGLLGPVILTVVILPVLPVFLGCVAGAGMFGVWGGFWCNYIGISAGSLIAFALARRFGVELVRKMVPMEKYDACVRWVTKKKSYTVILFLVILLPLAPDDFFCYFSGLTGMSAKRFTWIIAAAKPWCILAYSVFSAHFI